MADTKDPRRVKDTKNPEKTGLPPGWEVRHSTSKDRPYYFDSADKNSHWEPPPGTDIEKLKRFITVGRAVHLLVKHNESRRPASWKEAKITRSKEEARQIIEGYRESIIKHAESLRKQDKHPVEAMFKALGELAGRESDCSSASKQGDLGYFRMGGMQKSFADAAFALQPGEISGIVESDSGLHLILCLDQRESGKELEDLP